MDDRPPTERTDLAADERYLDELFDLALRQLGQGSTAELETVLAKRPDLREKAQEVVALARDVVTTRAPALPAVTGYELLRELGRGAMGAVYLARQQRVGGRLVALKVLPVSAALSPRARQRFLVEARALARLRHPNVVAVHDVVEQMDLCAYAMEWIDGLSLAAVLERLRQAGSKGGNLAATDLSRALGADSGRMHVDNVTVYFCRLGQLIARALSEVHRAGLLHRDVKPSNILLRRDGTALLSDFGLVRDPESTQHTEAGQFLGTLAYAAPEQLRGEHDAVSERSDVYALGATLYEVLSLARPFKGGAPSPAEMLRRIERGPEPLRHRAPGLSRDLETIVQKAMDPDSARRYASADELADDLERLLSLQPIRARPAGPVTLIIKLARRNRIGLAGLAAGVLVAIAPAVFIGIELHRDREKEAETLRHLAQVSLLDPQSYNRIYAAVFPEELEREGAAWDVKSAMRPPADTSKLDESLESYAQAVEVEAPDPTGLSVRLERDTVALARALLTEGDVEAHITLELARFCPCTVVRARTPARPRVQEPAKVSEHVQEPLGASGHVYAGSPNAVQAFAVPRDELVDPRESLTTVDRRHLGLLCFLLGDGAGALQAWKDLDLTFAADALVSGSLGEVHLLRDEPALAYPHLVDAMRAYPQVGFLCVNLADALVRLGQDSEAQLLLERVRGLPLLDTAETIERVQADLYATRAEVSAAVERYEYMMATHHSPQAFLHYACFLESQGRLGDALRPMSMLLRDHPTVRVYRRELLRMAEAWWASLPEKGSWRRLRPFLDRPEVCAGLNFFDLLVLLHSKSSQVADEPEARAWEGCAGALKEVLTRSTEKNRDRSLRSAPESSGGHYGMTLQQIAERNGVEAMTTTKYLTDSSSWLKDLHAMALTCPLPRLASTGLAFLRNARTSVFRAATLGAAMATATSVNALQNTSGGWTSLDNGQTNARRAHGQELQQNWKELWHVPRAPGETLVDEGIIVIQKDPSNLASFSGVDLATGTSLWTYSAGTAVNNASYGNCIVAGRVFLARSSAGSGINPPVTQRLECVDLHTGVSLWPAPWDSGVLGTIEYLTPVPSVAAPSGAGLTPDRVLFETVDVSQNNALKVWAFDATAPTAASAVLGHTTALTGVHFADGPLSVVQHPVGIDSFNWNVFLHRDVGSGGYWSSQSLDMWNVTTLSSPAFPCTGSIPLSGTKFQNEPQYSTLGNPLVVDGASGFLFESGGQLRAYDFDGISPLFTSHELWSVQATSTYSPMYPIVLSKTIVMLDNVAGNAKGYDRASGTLVWSTSLPATVNGYFRGVILDGDRVLTLHQDGSIHALDSNGVFSGPIVTVAGAYEVIATNGVYLVSTPTELICYKAANLIPRAPFKVGTTVTLDIASPADAGRSYACGFSFGTTPGITLPDGRNIPLNADKLLLYSLKNLPPLAGMLGTLDSTGHASASISVPNDPSLATLPPLYAGFVVFDVNAPSGILTISPAISVTFTP